MRKFSLFCTLIIISIAVAAEEVRYVSDSLIITMRTGQGTSHKIIKSPRTGTRMVLLEEDSETGYSRVRLDSGLEGWVLSRYLVNQPVAKTRLVTAEKKIDQLSKQVDQLKSELSSVSSNKNSLQNTSSQLEKDNKKLKKELAHIKDISSNQIAINDENKELKEKLLTLKRDMQTVQQENLSLQDSSARDWFLIGAGVLVVGVVMGLIVPNLRFRRKQTWDSL